MARSLNKVILIGNLTRDPELKYTPQGTAVCTFGLATNRQWVKDGEKKEDVEFHRIVVWSKLAELCGKLLAKGRKVYLEGRLQTRTWSGQDGVQHSTTEVIMNDMILLDSRSGSGGVSAAADFDVPESAPEVSQEPQTPQPESDEAPKVEKSEKEDEDIPF